jgi:hypothetical protein
MDWPLVGAVSAATIVAGVVAFELFALVRSDPEPVKRAPVLITYGLPVERSANELPGFTTSQPTTPAPSFPLIRLIDPDRSFPIEGQDPLDQASTAASSRKTHASAVSVSNAPQSDLKVAKLTTPELKLTQPDPQLRVDQWRVVVTAKASYFNLGGHVDRAGNVDGLASSHLRDALKAHRNFAQLPPDIRTHILTQNINLPKIAPYRGLLGIDDKTMEEEQAVRFERVVANR